MAGFDSGQVALLLRQIGSNDELLANAYVYGLIDSAMFDQRTISSLHKIGLIRPDEDGGEYRISNELKRMLNKLMRKQSSYRQLTDMGKVINALDDTVADFQLSIYGKQIDDAEFYFDQLDDLLCDAKDNLNQSLDHMHYAISSQFGFVTTLSAKVRENEKALIYAQKLLTELQQIDPESCYEWINWPCPNDFARKISNFIYWFNKTLPRLRFIIDIMRLSLFKLRRDEKQANQLRQMARYLRKHSEFELKSDLFAEPKLPQILKMAAPLHLKTYVDIKKSSLEEPLMGIIQSLRKIPKELPAITRETFDVEIASIEKIDAEHDHFEEQVELLFETAIITGDPISSIAFWKANIANWQENNHQIEPKAWIELVFSCYCKLTNELQNALDIKMKGVAVPGTTHNFTYNDVVIILKK